MRTWVRFVVFAVLVGGLYLLLQRDASWPPSSKVYIPAIAGLAGFAVLLFRRGSSRKTATELDALRPAEPQPQPARSDRAALLAGKIEQTLTGALESGEGVDTTVHCGTGQAIVVTDRRAIILRATPFRKSARLRSFPYHAIVFAEARTNLNIQGGRLRIGVAGDSPAGPFAPVRPSWGGDEMKFVDFSLDLQGQMERVAAFITERSGTAATAAPVRARSLV